MKQAHAFRAEHAGQMYVQQKHVGRSLEALLKRRLDRAKDIDADVAGRSADEQAQAVARDVVVFDNRCAYGRVG